MLENVAVVHIGNFGVREIFEAHNKGWRAISWLWVAMFATSAVANELAWRMLSTDDWITFKVFGLTGISLLFFIVSVPILQKHQRQN